ncbi:family 43 glycosylhydrolase [Mucilaginibacter sp. AW1-7]|uniref:family 43 glycosylhydrolase n=1 Tax=Mucilaginibacter sp. AW1-7 TaxID=3349874 RepID=UPI003F73C9B6
MNNIKSITLTAVFFLSAFLAQAQKPTQSKTKSDAYFVNPIFAGDYPDPAIMREGDDYYIVHSSFEYYPGLLIWHSKDLVNWAPVTHALNKYVGSVWAPNLVKYKNKYYIYFPASNSNFVVTADSINGPWSEPVELKVNFIDPGHFTDKAGKRYLYFNNGGYLPLSDDGLSITGELKPAYSGWKIPREWSIECFCLEGPTIAKRGDYYYLTVAQGGTAGPATSHMVISARSKTPFGPWENSPYDPIIRTKDNSEKWWSKGHGSLVEGPNGKWWMVFHAYEKGYYGMGRQTLLEPVEWTKDGWFKVPGTIKTDAPILKPKQSELTSSFTLSDDFSGHSLKPQWQFFGEYDTTRFHLNDNSLTIKGKGKSVADCAPLTFIPSNHSYTAQVELFIEGNATGGLTLFYDNRYYSGILADKQNILANLRGWQFPTEKNAINKHVFLKIRNIKSTVDMYYSIDGRNWIKIENSVEVSGYNHNVLGGFLSLRIGLCAVGEGTVKFKNFIYQPIN